MIDYLVSFGDNSDPECVQRQVLVVCSGSRPGDRRSKAQAGHALEGLGQRTGDPISAGCVFELEDAFDAVR
jgi:hypothetical protein